MDEQTKTALEKDKRRYLDAAGKFTRHAESIQALLDEAKEIEALMSSNNETLPLPLQVNGTHSNPAREMVRFRRVIGTMSQAQACAAALEARGELSTEEIFATIKELGLPVTLPKDHTHLAPVMSRKKTKFATAGRGKWKLVTEASTA